MARQSGQRSMFGIGLVVASIAAVGGILVYILTSSSSIATTDTQTVASASTVATGNNGNNGNIITGKIGKSDQSKRETGPSGLPVPRFVSLKRSKVNVRRGPSSEHKIAWVFHLKGLPVEIVAEFEHWRRVRDSDGQEGWIYHTLLAGKRTVTVAPWRKGVAVNLLKSPAVSGNIIANVNAGAIGNIEKCTGNWCQVNLGDYQGWINQSMLWGVYPGEEI